MEIQPKPPWSIPYQFNRKREKGKGKEKEKAAAKPPKNLKKSEMLRLLNEIRTYFKENPDIEFLKT